MAGPPAMHVDGGLHALESGCHLLTEKPPAPSTAELRKLASAAATAGRAGMVGHNLRYTAAWRRTAERIALDRVTSMVVTYHASGPTGGRWGLGPLQAFLLTHAVHVFDLFNAALGPPAATTHHVTDAGGGRLALSTRWETASGAAGTAVVTTCAPRLDWHAQLTTRDGTLADITSPRDVEIHTPQPGRLGRWSPRPLEVPRARRRL